MPREKVGRARFLFRAEHELVALAVLERRVAAPILRRWRRRELDAACDELVVRLFHVVGLKRHRLRRADTIFMAVGREQDDARVGAGNPELDPALLLAEGLVGGDREAERLR